MTNVSVFPSEQTTPRQSLMQAMEEVESMDAVAIVYLVKGEDGPRLTCSSMVPMELSFLADAMKHYAMKHLLE